MARRGTRQDLSHPLGVLGERAPTSVPVGLPDGARSEDVTPHEAVVWARGDGPGTLVVQLTAGAHVGRVLRGPAVDRSCDFTGRVVLTGLTPSRPYDAAVWFEGAGGTRGEVARLGFRTAPASRSATSFAWLLAGDDDDGPAAATTYAALRRTNPDIVIDLRTPADPVLTAGPAWHALCADVPVVAPDRGPRWVARGPLLDICCPGPEEAREPSRSSAVWTVVAGPGATPEPPGVLGLVTGSLAPAEAPAAAFGHARIGSDGVLSALWHDAHGEALRRTVLQPRR